MKNLFILILLSLTQASYVLASGTLPLDKESCKRAQHSALSVSVESDDKPETFAEIIARQLACLESSGSELDASLEAAKVEQADRARQADQFAARFAGLQESVGQLFTRVDGADGEIKQLGHEVIEIRRELDELHDYVKRDLVSIRRGEDKNIVQIEKAYCAKSRDFYIALRDGLFAISRYLLMHTTGNLDAPMGDAGDKIDKLEHFAGLATALITVLPIPFIEGIDILLNEVVYQGADQLRKRILASIEAKFNKMYGLFFIEQAKSASSTEYFCKIVALRITERCIKTIRRIDDFDTMKSLIKDVVREALEECVGSSEDIAALRKDISTFKTLQTKAPSRKAKIRKIFSKPFKTKQRAQATAPASPDAQITSSIPKDFDFQATLIAAAVRLLQEKIPTKEAP